MLGRSSTTLRQSIARSAAAIVVLTLAGADRVAAQDAIALAVAPLPSESQAAAAKVIQKQGMEWVTLREGSGNFICIADDPTDDRFHSVCYHTSLEPYMARGRELTAAGTTGRPNVEMRLSEIEAGTLEMPDYAMLHQIFGPGGWAGDMEADIQNVTVIYTPFATGEDLGLPTRATRGAWLMGAGSANAHVMITP